MPCSTHIPWVLAFQHTYLRLLVDICISLPGAFSEATESCSAQTHGIQKCQEISPPKSGSQPVTDKIQGTNTSAPSPCRQGNSGVCPRGSPTSLWGEAPVGRTGSSLPVYPFLIMSLPCLTSRVSWDYLLNKILSWESLPQNRLLEEPNYLFIYL